MQEVAEACELSRSMLSKIETGKASPTVSTLTRIAEALGVQTATLLEDREEDATSYTSRKTIAERGLISTSKGYEFFLLAEHRLNKQFQPFLFEAERGKVKDGPMSHSGEEFIYVLDGSMKYRVGNVEYLLEAGDSLYFSSAYEHDLEPVTEKVRYIGVFSERPTGTS